MAIISAVGDGVLDRGSPLSSADFLLAFEASWNFGGSPPVLSGYFLGGTELSCWTGGTAPVVSSGVCELMIVGGNKVEGVLS